VKRIASLLTAAIILSGCNKAQLLTPDQKRTLEAKPAVVLVVVRYVVNWALVKNHQIPHTEVGTGFIYRPDGYIITNGHVVQDAHLKDPDARKEFSNMVNQEFEEALQRGIIFGMVEQDIGRRLTAQERERVIRSTPNISISTPTLDVFTANGKSYTARILQWDNPIGKGKDVAILKIAGSDLPTVPLGDSDKVRVQDPVMVIGYPGIASKWGANDLVSNESNFVPSATNGHISAIKKSNIDTPLFQSDAAITHGNSGGPVFNEDGDVIGIATAGAQSTQGFNWFVPMNTAMEFVRQAGAQPAISPFNHVWTQALDLYDSGKCRDSIGEFDSALELMPGLADASQYRNAASKCWEDKNGFQRLIETSRWVIYVAVAIAILAVAAFAMRSRSTPVQVAAQPATRIAGVAPGGTRLESAPSPPTLPLGQSYGNIQATAGALSGKTFKVPREGLLIGRSPKCQVVLQDDTVSSEHAWIVPSGNEVVVIDKGSSNGTYVNSVESPKVSKIGLRNGDRVFLGKKGANVFTYFNS
jgi:serine protease Do